MNTNKSINLISYSDSSLKSYIESLNEINLESSYYVLILSGSLKSGKKKVLNRLKNKLGSFKEVDLREYITVNEEESYQKIDALFDSLAKDERNILLRNGDVLAGEYTGHTYSSVRYATPQEKYLLNKIRTSERFYVIDILEFENIDKTLGRFAQKAITFNEPDSLFGKLLWKLRQVSVHGHTFANKRRPAG